MSTSSTDHLGRVQVPGGADLVGRVLQPGEGSGSVLRLEQPLSLWGGTATDGMIIERQHPQYGQSITGRVLAMTAGRGSSSSSSVLAEQIRSGTGPVAVLLAEPDAIVALGAIVAAELYAVRVPVLVLEPEEFASLASGMEVRVSAPRAEPR